jgi:L-alanine-DL-glutamate epimerase-like enolase superfamily enzyme
MKITRLDVFQLSYGLHERTYAWSGGHAVSRFLTTIVKVSTDEGLAGFGEVCPLGAGYMAAHAHGVPAGIREVGPALIGMDPTRLRALNAAMDAALSGHQYVKAPIDVACWDILGQALGAPVAELLGGRWADDHLLYRAISQDAPEAMAASVERYRDEGYRRFQLKVGGDPDVDIARVTAVARVLGPGDVLIADANTGWLPHQALRVVHGVRDIDCYVEQPCATLAECLVVRERTHQPMVIDELITGVGPLLEAHHARAMDAVNIKISRVGGLTRARQLRDLCESLGVVMTIEDSWGGDVTTAAIAHLAGSTRPEYLFTATDFNSYVDVSVAEDAPRRQAGRLPVPTGPGLGIHVDEARLGEPVLTVPSPT